MGVDICELFHHLNTNQIKNDDEAPYFLMGQSFSDQQIANIKCDARKPHFINKRDPFWKFSAHFALNTKKMERIYSLTCPSEINPREYKGKMSVSNHAQYIDLNTVIRCDLYYWKKASAPRNKHGFIQTGDLDTSRMDASKSYVTVKDFVSDD